MRLWPAVVAEAAARAPDRSRVGGSCGSARGTAVAAVRGCVTAEIAFGPSGPDIGPLVTDEAAEASRPRRRAPSAHAPKEVAQFGRATALGRVLARNASPASAAAVVRRCGSAGTQGSRGRAGAASDSTLRTASSGDSRSRVISDLLLGEARRCAIGRSARRRPRS